MDFIVIEGIDGSGKSSVIKEIEKIFENQKINYIFFKEPPENNALLKDLRIKILQKSENMHLNNLLFLSARALLIKDYIIPSLIKNKTVICDRSFISNIAYQGKVENMGVKKIYNQNIELFNSFGVIGKSILNNMKIVYLDVSVDVAKKRNKNANSFDKQPINYFLKVKQGYKQALKFFPKENVKVINADQALESVVKELKNILLQWKVLKSI